MNLSEPVTAWVWRAVATIALAALGGLPPMSFAADATRGRDLYLNAAALKQRPGLKSCVQCHGLPPEAKLWGASAVQLQGAIGSVVDMAAYANELSATDLADLAAFLVQPMAVPLPQPRLAPLQPRFAALSGTMSPALSFRLDNSGTGPFVLGAAPIRLLGTAAEDFILDVGSCAPAATLSAGASCAFVLRFTPAATVAAGTRRSTELRIEYQSIAAPTVAQIDSAAAPVGALSLSATGLSFAAPGPLAAAPAQTLVLANGGQANLTFQLLTVSGVAAGDFSVAGPCAQGSSLAPGAQCELQVSFRPVSAGVRTAQLQLAWDGGAAGVALTGASTAASSPAAPPPSPGVATTTNSGGGGALQGAFAAVLIAGMLRRRQRAIVI